MELLSSLAALLLLPVLLVFFVGFIAVALALTAYMIWWYTYRMILVPCLGLLIAAGAVVWLCCTGRWEIDSMLRRLMPLFPPGFRPQLAEN